MGASNYCFELINFAMTDAEQVHVSQMVRWHGMSVNLCANKMIASTFYHLKSTSSHESPYRRNLFTFVRWYDGCVYVSVSSIKSHPEVKEEVEERTK